MKPLMICGLFDAVAIAQDNATDPKGFLRR
jgi:hypothetical protein